MTISATAALTAADERRLVSLAQAGDETATTALVTSQLRYLRAEANKYGRVSGVDLDDLVSAGMEALLESLAGFDRARGVRLFTYAQTHIREAMADEVAAHGAIAVPGRTLRRYRRAIRETSTLAEARELARTRDGMAADTFDSVHHALTGGTSMDSETRAPGQGGAGTMDRGDTITSERSALGSRGPAPEPTAISRALVRQALGSLDDRQRRVVVLAFLGGEPLSDGEIAGHLGLSRPTVTRARNAALAVMRAALA